MPPFGLHSYSIVAKLDQRAFLAKAGLSTERFVGSNAAIGFLVDLTRISVYVALFSAAGGKVSDFSGWPLVICGCAQCTRWLMVCPNLIRRERLL